MILIGKISFEKKKFIACLDIIAQNLKNLKLKRILNPNISLGPKIHMDFFLYFGTHIGSLQFPEKKFMWILGPGPESGVKVRFSSIFHFLPAAIMGVALSLVHGEYAFYNPQSLYFQ